MQRVGDRKELLDAIRGCSRIRDAMEVGVFRGDFAEQMRERLDCRRLWLVDPWSEDTDWLIGETLVKVSGPEALDKVTRRFRDDISAGAVRLVREASPRGIDWVSWLTSEDPRFDFVYIDGSHLYLDVLEDLWSSYHLVMGSKRGVAWLAGHDYCEIYEFGVPRAVDAFCAATGLSVTILTEEKPLPAINRYGINAGVGETVAYNSFAIMIDRENHRHVSRG